MRREFETPDAGCAVSSFEAAPRRATATIGARAAGWRGAGARGLSRRAEVDAGRRERGVALACYSCVVTRRRSCDNILYSTKLAEYTLLGVEKKNGKI